MVPSSVSTAKSSSSSPSSQIAAFFDIDKTLLATDSVGKEAEELWAESWRDGQYYLYLKFCLLAFLIIPLYQIGFLSAPGVNRVYIRWIYKNRYLHDLQSRSRTLYEKKLRHRLYPEMVQAMFDHKAKGHAVFIVSASPEHLLTPFVEDYRNVVDGLAATRLETKEESSHDKDGVGVVGTGANTRKMTAAGLSKSQRQRCTGRPIANIVCIGAEKERVQERLAIEFGIDLEKSYAYSDHHHDLEFLQSVGHPVAVNPTWTLAGIAKKRDWPILRFHREDNGKGGYGA